MQDIEIEKLDIERMPTKSLPTELTFYLNAYQDTELLSSCLAQLRRVYPQSRLIIRSDGASDAAIGELAQMYNGECYYGERLMGIEKGGQIVHEMLRLFLTQHQTTRYLFKIDPDTIIARQFQALPNEPCVFGTLQRQISYFSIQGGCIGFTLDVAQQLYDSGYFLNPTLGQSPPAWAITESVRERVLVHKLTSIDWVIGWACKEMGIQLIDWPEIMSEWLVTPKNDDLRYAITHPHKPNSPTEDGFRCAWRFMAHEFAAMTAEEKKAFIKK